MATKELSALLSGYDKESPLMMLVLKKTIMESMEVIELEHMHSFLGLVIAGEVSIEDAEDLYGPEPCELLTKDQADRLVFDWLNENKLDIGQSTSNLLSENRRQSLTDDSLKKGMFKGNRHKYGKCPYVEINPLLYFKSLLLRWLENNVRPKAKSIGLAS